MKNFLNFLILILFYFSIVINSTASIYVLFGGMINLRNLFLGVGLFWIFISPSGYESKIVFFDEKASEMVVVTFLIIFFAIIFQLI